MPKQKPIRVLITGFGPFPGAASNPSGPLVERLARMRRPALRDVEIVSHVFPTRYADVDRDLASLLKAHDPDIILMFGLAARARHIRVEMRARNLISSFPDAGGRAPRNRIIVVGADHRRLAPALGMRLLQAARSFGLKAGLSRDAGRYVCNYAYWRALEDKPASNRQRLAAFIHIPNLRRAGAKKKFARRPDPGFAPLTRTGNAILLGMLAAHRRARLSGRG